MIVILDKAETPPMALHASMEEDDTSVAAGSVASSVASSVVSSMAIETRHLQRREKRGGERGAEGKERKGRGDGGEEAPTSKQTVGEGSRESGR